MSTVQSKIEDLLQKSVGTIIKKPSQAGLPKIADTTISSIEVVSSKAISVDINWKGRGLLMAAPGVSLKDNPAIAEISRISGGGLLLKTNQIHFNKAPLELTLHGNIYKIKGMSVSYSF